jgi:hypothetical protein
LIGKERAVVIKSLAFALIVTAVTPLCAAQTVLRSEPLVLAPYEITHVKLVRDQWQAMQIIPGPWMGVGMAPKPAQWFERVLDRVLANGMSDYERAVFGK